MLTFYHKSDLDGHCSGYVVKRAHPNCDLYGIDYGDEFPWDIVEKHNTIIMVDFSLQPFSEMEKLVNKCEKLIWIDHHKSAIDEYSKSTITVDGLIRNGIGACQLCWEYFFPTELVPYFIKLLAEYDVWIHSNPDTLPFQYGLRLENTNPYNLPLWESLFERPIVREVIKRGETVLRYEEIINERYVKSRGFELEWEGLKFICCNKGLTNSKLFDSIWDTTKYDAMLTFCMLDPERGWTVSLYSDKSDVDVSKIAKKYGGGGHKGAAGFQCKTLPFVQ